MPVPRPVSSALMNSTDPTSRRARGPMQRSLAHAVAPTVGSARCEGYSANEPAPWTISLRH